MRRAGSHNTINLTSEQNNENVRVLETKLYTNTEVE